MINGFGNLEVTVTSTIFSEYLAAVVPRMTEEGDVDITRIGNWGIFLRSCAEEHVGTYR